MFWTICAVPVDTFLWQSATYGPSVHCIHFSEDEPGDVCSSLKPRLLVKSISFWAYWVSVSLRWLHMTCLVGVLSQLADPIECGAAELEVTEEDEMTHSGSQNGVNNGLSCRPFWGSFPPLFTSGSGSTSVIHCMFTLRHIHLLRMNLCSCSLHSLVSSLEMSNVCACNCFYPGYKSFTKLNKKSVSNTKQQGCW